MTIESPEIKPIPEDQRAFINALGKEIDVALNGKTIPKKIGFFLAIFPFDTDPAAMGGRFSYVSNADKLDVRVMLKEILARIEGRLAKVGNPQ